MLPNHTLRNRYKIIKLLGSGSFGITYLAEDLDLPDHPLCVVKKLRQTQSQEELKIFINFFDKEAKALYRLGRECSQIPQLFAHFEEGGEFYLVQEYIDGHDLSQEIFSGNKLSEAKVKEILIEVLEVLTIIHNKNIIHRDIKAQNLMRRNSDGKIVLIDFGTVKEISKLTVNPQEPTKVTVVIGTSGYMPIEQLNGYPKLSSDVYAVGMLGIYALTGIRPQDLPKDPNTFEVIWRDQVSVSPFLLSVLDKMVRSNFKERYQTAGEAWQALTAPSFEPTRITASSESTQQTPTSLPLSISPISHFSVANRRFLIGAGVLLSLIVGMGLFFINFSRRSTIDVQLVCPETPLPPLPSTGARQLGIATVYGFSDEKQPTGKGIIVFPDKQHGGNIRFDGELKSGKFDGCGSYTYGNGDRYVGQFVDNHFQGMGKFIYSNGCEYIGYYEKSKRTGQGTCRLKDDSYLSGIWQDNKLKVSNQTCICK
jgi:serine/threonine protein kinase